MKKFILIFTVLFVLFSETGIAYADSPVTSTPFSKAYYDVDLVEKASRRNTITADMAEYLADENNPIDVKAAIINALSWDVKGKNNTEIYCDMIYGKSLKDMDASTLSGDQQFCIGYLIAMDDIHFHTTQAMDYLRMARSNMKDSLTVALITSLVEMMNEVSYDWSDQIKNILDDPGLNRDLSDAAIKVITDYMLLGIDNPVSIPKTGTQSLGYVFGLGAMICLIMSISLSNSKKTEIHRNVT